LSPATKAAVIPYIVAPDDPRSSYYPRAEQAHDRRVPNRRKKDRSDAVR
jgi:hypothetical protein